MIDCEKAREQLALQPSGDDESLQQHLAECATCARYSQRQQSLDAVLRTELRWTAPSALMFGMKDETLPIDDSM